MATRPAGGQLPAEASSKVDSLNEEAVRIARDVTLPIAAELEELVNKTVLVAKEQADVEAVAMQQEMARRPNARR